MQTFDNINLKATTLSANLGMKFLHSKADAMKKIYHEHNFLMYASDFRWNGSNFQIFVPCEDRILSNGYISTENDMSDYFKYYDLTDWALSQLCVIFKLPKSYFNYCCSEGMENQMVNLLNAHSATSFKDYKLLCYDDVAYGVVSLMYGRISHSHVLDTIDSYITDRNLKEEMDIVNYHITPDYLHIRMIDKEPFYTDYTGTQLYYGFIVQNSEIGRSHLFIKSFIYRLVCSNGLTTPLLGTQMRKRHIGKSLSLSEITLDSIFGNNTKNIKNYLRYIIQSSENSYLSNDIVNNIGLNIGFDENTTRLLKQYNMGNGYNNTDIDNENTSYRLYDIINGITFYARHCSIEKRNQLEEKACKILEKYTNTQNIKSHNSLIGVM